MQDLHGYDNPWPGGGGANRLNVTDFTETISGVTIKGENDALIISGTASATISAQNAIWKSIKIHIVEDGKYYFVKFGDLPSGAAFIFYDSQNNSITISGLGNELTAGEYTLGMYIPFGAEFGNGITCKFSVTLTSFATAWAPYANICPISGHTEAEIYHEAEYDADADPAISVTFPTTIYGGTVTLNEDGSADVVATDADVDLGTLSWSSAPTALSGKNRFIADVPGLKIGSNINALCSQYKKIETTYDALNTGFALHGTLARILIYDETLSSATAAEFKTAMSGVQFVYELATPQTYHFDNIGQLMTFLGTNNVWTDTGDVTVTYIANAAKFSFGSPLHTYNYVNLKLFGNTYIEHGKG